MSSENITCVRAQNITPYIQNNQTQVRLHFEGWDDRYDETVSLTSCPSRIAPLDSYTLGAYTGGKGTKSINKHINPEFMEMRLKMFLRHVCASVDVSKVLTSLREDDDDEKQDMDTVIRKSVQRYEGEYTELARIVESSVGLPQGMFLSQHLRIPLSGHANRRANDRMNEGTKEEECVSKKIVRVLLRLAAHVELEDIRSLFDEHCKYASRCDAKELHRSDGSNATAPSSPLFGRFGIIASRRRSSNLPKLTGGVSVPFDLCVENDILLSLSRIVSPDKINRLKPSHGFAVGQRVEARWVTRTGNRIIKDRNWYVVFLHQVFERFEHQLIYQLQVRWCHHSSTFGRYVRSTLR